MRLPKLLYRTGSASLILVGLGHLATSLLMPKNPQQLAMVQTMQGFAIDFPGPARNLYHYHEGFSIMMGMLLVSYGVLAILIERAATLEVALTTPLMAFHMLVTLGMLLVSLNFFFAVPIGFTAAAFLAYTLAWVTGLHAPAASLTSH